VQWLPLTFAALLVLSCLPVFLRLLLPPLPPSDRTDAPRCVLVLGAGRRSRNGSLRLSTRSLLRLEAAAALARRERLPLLVSGGAPGIEGTSEAELMARAVGKRDAALTIWRETDSHNTYENALFSARELAQHGVGRVYLVTDRVHLCRALLCLKKQGISAVPHAADLFPQPDFLPHAGALALWPELMYEWLALGWYLLRRRL
jgi:uncharacterized SAM-binding protein YcdF (DUF218 family)